LTCRSQDIYFTSSCNHFRCILFNV